MPLLKFLEKNNFNPFFDFHMTCNIKRETIFPFSILIEKKIINRNKIINCQIIEFFFF